VKRLLFLFDDPQVRVEGPHALDGAHLGGGEVSFLLRLCGAHQHDVPAYGAPAHIDRGHALRSRERGVDLGFQRRVAVRRGIVLDPMETTFFLGKATIARA
jgi:hypothetical protein